MSVPTSHSRPLFGLLLDSGCTRITRTGLYTPLAPKMFLCFVWTHVLHLIAKAPLQISGSASHRLTVLSKGKDTQPSLMSVSILVTMFSGRSLRRPDFSSSDTRIVCCPSLPSLNLYTSSSAEVIWPSSLFL